VLSLFRTNQLLYSVLLLFYAALLHVSVFILPDAWTPSAPGLLSNWVYELLGGYRGWGAEITALLLLCIQATGINAIAMEYRLGEESNLFPGLFYILLCSALPVLTHLSPALMANTFLIIALSELYAVYKKPSAAASIFNVGFWVAIASLFSPGHLVFLLLGFIGLNILRGLSLRERLMVVVGAVVPYLLVGIYLFWNGQLAKGIAQHFEAGLGFLQFKPSGEFEVWAASVVFGLCIVLALFSYGGMVYRKTIQVQKQLSLLYWMLLIGAGTVLVQAGVQTDQWLAVGIPAGIILGFVFSNLPRRWSESLHLMLLAAILILHYKQFLLP
jgi:hypothetical protein